MKHLSLDFFKENAKMQLDRDQLKMILGGANLDRLTCTAAKDRPHFMRYRVTYWSCSNGKAYVTVSELKGGMWNPFIDIEYRES